MPVPADVQKIQAATRHLLEKLHVDVTRQVPLRALARAVARQVGCDADVALPYVAQVVRVLRAQQARRHREPILDLALVLHLVLDRYTSGDNPR